jgi:outer membrane receptor protein involved in Fe transport
VAVVFATDSAGRARTASLRGSYTTAEAIALLLRDSGLTAVASEKTGTLTITRDPNGPRAPLAPSAAAPASRSAVNPPGDDEKPLVLSPFTVSSEQDTGYQATNTLAGTRLNTALNEVGTAVSVITKELLNDLGVNESGALLPYTVSTEVGGIDGNFAGGAMADRRNDQAGARAEPERNQRVRGLAAAELTRDYFLSDIPFDAYNTDRVTINRGPNALLFGIGSPGGVVNNGTIMPVFGANFLETKVQVGQRHTHRESFDLNRVLIPRRLAVRLAGLNERLEFQQRPAWERDQRIFGAVTAVLAENRRSPMLGPTTLRMNAEYGDIASNPPNTVPPSDAISSWWSLPSRDLQRFTGTTFPAYYDTYAPKQTIDNRNQQTLPAPTTIPYFLTFAAIYPQPGRPDLGIRDAQGRVINGGQGRILWTGVPDRIRLDVYTMRHAFTGGEFPGFDNPSIQDPGIFDFYNRLYTGETNRVNRDFRAGTFTLEQSLWRGRAGFELSYDEQRYRIFRQTPFNGAAGDIKIDINQYLGNDLPNPNLGRPFFNVAGLPQTEAETERDTARASVFLKLDGRDLFGKGRAGFWFGRHTLTGMYFDNNIATRSRTYNLGYDSDQVNLTTLQAQTIDQFRRHTDSLIYVGPSLLGARNFADARFNSIDVVLPQHGDRHLIFYFDPSGPPAARGVRNVEATVRRFLQAGGIGRREIKSSVASLQSHFLDNHLIGIAGIRRDEQETYERLNLDNDADPLTRDRLPPGDFDPAAIRLRSEPSEIAKGDTLTWSLVGRYPARLLGKLPLGADLRAFANRSENFSPVGIRRDIANNLQAPPTGTTKEYGLIFDLFDGKISARVNRYETSGTGFTNPALQGGINYALNSIETLSLTRLLDAQTSGFTLDQLGLSQVGVTSFDEAYREIINFIPEPARSVRNLRIETVGGVRRVVGNPILGAVGTSSFVAKGWELDLTGNPARGLRLSLNVAQQNTVKSNIAPEYRRFAEEMRQNIDRSPMRNIRDSPTLGEVATHYARFFSSVTVPLAAEVAKEGTKSLEQREWRVNVVTNYDLPGRLRGWGLGAALRWQSEVATGYPNFVNPNGSITPDLNNPYFGDPELNGDGWLSYKRRIFKDKVAWRIQLNIRNLIGSDSLIPVTTNPHGQAAIVRIPPERQWFVTNTFRF